MKRSIPKPVEPAPPMTRGETEFEEKHMEADFALVMGKMRTSCFKTFTESCEWIYRQAYFAGKAAGKRESETR